MSTTEPEVRYHFGINTSVDLLQDDGLVLAGPAGSLPLGNLSRGQRGVIDALAGRGATEEELFGVLTDAESEAALPWLFFTLTRLTQNSLIETSLVAEGFSLATVCSLSREYRPNNCGLPADQPVLLCRFAYLRRDEQKLVLESPRSLARLLLHDWRGPALLTALSSAVVPGEYSAQTAPGISRNTAEAFLLLLHQSGFLDPGPPRASIVVQEASEQALAQWEFHDLLFHSRSRAGRHRNPWGATYSWEGKREPLPAVKEVSGKGISLFQPDIDALELSDRSFTAVLESRRSLRIPGERALSAAQLGEFLFRTSRVRGRTRTDREEVSNRPYPGGGADYELEIYPIIQRVDGLAQGLYYYHPLQHQLFPRAEFGPPARALLSQASQKARLRESPDVLLCVAARLQRLTYKYSSIAYAVMLKDLGVLYQTFYLVASAMEVAACALGGGDADLFARATGLGYYVEPSVGEFMLSSPSSLEETRPVLPTLRELVIG